MTLLCIFLQLKFWSKFLRSIPETFVKVPELQSFHRSSSVNVINQQSKQTNVKEGNHNFPLHTLYTSTLPTPLTIVPPHLIT